MTDKAEQGLDAKNLAVMAEAVEFAEWCLAQPNYRKEGESFLAYRSRLKIKKRMERFRKTGIYGGSGSSGLGRAGRTATPNPANSAPGA